MTQQTHPHRPCALWFTGLSGSGKSTTANAVQQELKEMGRPNYLLDGDSLRTGLCKDLGFSAEDRKENIRRVGEVAKLLVDAGLITIVATISPYATMRDAIRTHFPQGNFIEIFVDAPLAVCEERDPKGLYRKARAGEIKQFTGIDSSYDTPTAPEIHLRTHEQSPAECLAAILDYLFAQGYLPKQN